MTDPDIYPFHRHQGADNQPCTWCGANADRAVHSQTYARRGHHEWVETPPVESGDGYVWSTDDERDELAAELAAVQREHDADASPPVEGYVIRAVCGEWHPTHRQPWGSPAACQLDAGHPGDHEWKLVTPPVEGDDKPPTLYAHGRRGHVVWRVNDEPSPQVEGAPPVESGDR